MIEKINKIRRIIKNDNHSLVCDVENGGERVLKFFNKNEAEFFNTSDLLLLFNVYEMTYKTLYK